MCDRYVNTAASDRRSPAELEKAKGGHCCSGMSWTDSAWIRAHKTEKPLELQQIRTCRVSYPPSSAIAEATALAVGASHGAAFTHPKALSR